MATTRVIPAGQPEECASCECCFSAIHGVYFAVDEAIVCESCRVTLAASGGTQFQRGLRSIFFGAIAAATGSLFYFAVFALTGLEFGILAVAVGWFVGTAVRKGSRSRGGWAYQILAIVLTYAAIALSYVPLVQKELQKAPPKDPASRHVALATRLTVPMADTITISASAPAVGRAIDSAAAVRRERESFPVTQAGIPSRTSATPGGLARLGFGRIVLLAIVVPIAASFSSIMSFLIIAVALFAAWLLNRRVAVSISGPYPLAGAEA